MSCLIGLYLSIYIGLYMFFSFTFTHGLQLHILYTLCSPLTCLNELIIMTHEWEGNLVIPWFNHFSWSLLVQLKCCSLNPLEIGNFSWTSLEKVLNQHLSRWNLLLSERMRAYHRGVLMLIHFITTWRQYWAFLKAFLLVLHQPLLNDVASSCRVGLWKNMNLLLGDIDRKKLERENYIWENVHP